MSISQLYETDEIIPFTPQYSAVIRTILFYNCHEQLQYTRILEDIKNEVPDTPMLQLLWYKIWFLRICFCKATKLSENQVPERTSTTLISLSTSQAVDHLQGAPVIKASHMPSMKAPIHRKQVGVQSGQDKVTFTVNK